MAGDGRKRVVDGGFVDAQFNQSGFKVQRQRGFVADRFFERVAAHIAVLVFIGAEGPVGIAIALVDGRAGQAEQKRIGQRLAHLLAQIAFLRAMGFVHEDDDVRSGVEHAVGFREFMNRGDDDFAHILRQQRLQLIAALGGDQVGHIGGVEGGRDLRVEIDPIDDDQHGRVSQADRAGAASARRRPSAAICPIPENARSGPASPDR